MTTEEMTSKNFGLTENGFKDMVVELIEGNEEMFEHIYLKHFKICVDYLRSEYNCAYTDAYDCTMETLLDFRLGLIKGKIKYGNIKYLFTRMSANRYLKSKKRLSKFDFLEKLPERRHAEIKYSGEELDILDKAWKRMGAACQRILKLYFFDKIKMVEIAKNEDKTAAAIRKQKERCVNVLRNNFLKFV